MASAVNIPSEVGLLQRVVSGMTRGNFTAFDGNGNISLGFSLDFIQQVVQDTGVFGATWGGNWKGLDLYVSNALTKPTDDTAAGASNPWYMYIGHDAAIAAPRRRMRNDNGLQH